jgi:EAL domain-containing protein (putative c-di-GMP-specific phosphodiesterase class I)
LTLESQNSSNERTTARQAAECNEVQGFLIGRPAPIERYSDLVNNKPARSIRAVAG